MEILNQSTSMHTQLQNRQNCEDVHAVGNYVAPQQRQQPSQMSGPHRRPSNGSNNLEQHAMRPTTTGGDPSNRVFHDQKKSINGCLQQGNSMQIRNMMHMRHNSMQHLKQQQNHVESYNLLPQDSLVRLPPLTLNPSKFSSTVLLSNGIQCQNLTQVNVAENQIEGTQNLRQMSENEQTTISHNNILLVKEQLFDQQISRSIPVMAQQCNNQSNHVLPSQNVAYPQNQPNQINQCSENVQTSTPNSNISNHSSLLSMNQNQMQSGIETGNLMISSFQVNQSQEQVPHLSHMDQPAPTQHSMNSIPQNQVQQHPGQISCSSSQMSLQNQVLSPTNSNSTMPLNMNLSASSSSISSPMKSAISPSISPRSIPMNANSTTQLLMALKNNSPITAEQLQEMQNMASTAADGTEMLLMQEPRLKQYSSLKDMSTNDLRLECKKRILPSTGTKMRLCERLTAFEGEVLDERNHQMMKEYTHRQQMYEAQEATLKTFQAKKDFMQSQKKQSNGSDSGSNTCTNFVQALSSNETTSPSQTIMNQEKSVDGPPTKKKRSKPKKSAQQHSPEKHTNLAPSRNASKAISSNDNNQCNLRNSVGSNRSITNIGINGNNDIITIIGENNNQSSLPFSNISSQSNQNTSNIFGGMNQTGTGFFMKDNSCFSHLGSGCRLITTSSNEESQNTFGGTGRAFQAAVPPPPENSGLQFQQSFSISNQIEQQGSDAVAQISPSRPINLNQQQLIDNPSISHGISNMFHISTPTSLQQQQHSTKLSQQSFINSSMPQNGLQASPCVADQAGSSPNMPVSDPTTTTSGSPVVVGAVAENDDSAELMDLETMQQLLSPATLRAREELLTQQQAKINELVKLIQKNHDTLREQQQQINLAKKQQKQRQRQHTPPTACVLDKHINSRCIQHAIKNRQNYQILNELTKQQDSIRTAETRLIEQLHINTATDDIARLIKQDGRTALVIVSLLHDYRTTREQNNRAKSATDEQVVADNTADIAKKKAPARKRNNNGLTKSVQTKKAAQQKPQADIEVVQIIKSPNENNVRQPQYSPPSQNSQNFMESPQPQVKLHCEKSQSDVDMEAIFKTVIDASRAPQKEIQKTHSQQPQQLLQSVPQQYDNEVISLSSEVSSPMHTQSQSSVQSVFSDISYSRTISCNHENSPQQMTYVISTGAESSSSPNNVQCRSHEIINHSTRELDSRPAEVIDILPQYEMSTLDHDLENQQFHDNMIFNEDSNQGYMDQNSQSIGLDFDFPDIDQMVANIRDSDPLSCPLDDIDLTAILNSWTDDCESKQNDEDPHIVSKINGMCDDMMYDSNGSINQMTHFNEEMDWGDYNTQSNIINQAFEQSQLN